MLLMIDNYDSFTYNLVHYFRELKVDVLVKRNDEITLDEVQSLNPQYLVISPGPCGPEQAGISIQLIEHIAGKIPILGVCLGHQCIGQAFGGKIIHAKKIMHGKTSKLYHRQQGIFANIESPYTVTRYHSLVVDKETLPECLEVTAWCLDKEGNQEEIMGLRHKTLPIEGVQFHPESILTEHGHEILNNFIQQNKETVRA